MVRIKAKFISQRTIFTIGVLLYSFILAGYLVFRLFFSNTEFQLGLEGNSASMVTLVFDKGYRLSFTRKEFFANFQKTITFYFNGKETPPEKQAISFEKNQHFEENTYPVDYSDIREYAIREIVISRNFRQIKISGPEILDYYFLRDMLLLKTEDEKIVVQTLGLHPELKPFPSRFERLEPEFAWEQFRLFVITAFAVSAAIVLLLYGLVYHQDFVRRTADRFWWPVRQVYSRWPRISALAVLSGMVLAFLPMKSERALCSFFPSDKLNAKEGFFLVRGSNFSGLEFKIPEAAEKTASGDMTLELYEKGDSVPIRKHTLPESQWKGQSDIDWNFFPVLESRDKTFSLKISQASARNIILEEPPAATFLLFFNHAVIIGILSMTAVVTWCMEFLKRLREKNETKQDVPHRPKKQFDYGMHYFRAFAIICIVFAHFFHTDLSFSIFNCSTIFFLFISGYLLIYLDRNDFHTGTYYRKKFMSVLLPYIIIAVLIYLYRMQNIDVSSIFWYYKNLPLEVLLGYRICVQFWYIPFIAIVFLFTPLLMKMPRSWLRNITLVSLFVPLYAVRRDFLTGFLNSVEVFAFFVPVYLAGMCYALDKEKIDAVLRKYWIHMAVVSLGLTLFIYFRNTEVPVNTAALYVQKMFFAGLVVLGLNLISHKKIHILDLFAKYSFSIYFLHVFLGEPLMVFFGSYVARLGIQQDSDPVTVISGVCSLFTVLFICVLLKQITGRYSRNLFGG